jgi:hypothetical protein
MAKEGRELIKEAVNDAKSLKEVAIEAAKNELIDAMAPKIRTLLESSIKGMLNEKRGLRPGDGDKEFSQSQRGDYMSPAARKFQENSTQGENMMDEQNFDESLTSFFPQLSEAEDTEDAEGEEVPCKAKEVEEESFQFEGDIPNLDDEETSEVEGMSDMEEEVEISEAELRKVYESALQTEVQVKKAFSEPTKSGELDEVDPTAGIAEFKKGEHPWEKEEPPAKQDWTVKEMIQRGLHENKRLRANNVKLTKIVKYLGGKLHEVNLFNAKVLHVNRILNSNGRLTTEQKTVVLESIDKAKTIDQVKMVYEAIVKSFKASNLMSESKIRRPSVNAQRARTSGAPNQKVLSESVDNGKDDKYARMRKLAGLLK